MQGLKRYTLPLVLGAFALILTIIGALAVTVWSPPQQVSALRSTEAPFTMTRAGVLRLYEPHQEVAGVRVEATAPDNQTVWLATGSPEDVLAWLQNEPYDEITGLSDLETLKALPHEAVNEAPQSGDEVPADDADAEQAQSGEESNPVSSDMWTAVKYGTGSVTLELSGAELDQALLAATDGVGPAPTLTLTWLTPQKNVLAMVAFLAAAAFLILALGTWIFLYGRRDRTRVSSVARSGGEDTQDTADEAAQLDEIADADEALELAEVAEVVVDEVPVTDSADEEHTDDTDAAAIDEEAVAVDQESVDVDQESVDVDEDVVDVDEDVADGEAVDIDEELVEVEEDHADVDEQQDAEVLDEEAVDEGDPQEDASGLVEETVTTDSGMMNLAALQSGFGYPTRRALREAEGRGVETLVVGERRFSTKTGELPIVSDVPEDALGKRTRRPLSWSQLMGQAAKAGSSESDPQQDKGEQE